MKAKGNRTMTVLPFVLMRSRSVMRYFRSVATNVIDVYGVYSAMSLTSTFRHLLDVWHCCYVYDETAVMRFQKIGTYR